jgi:hypothetical protein
MRSSLMAEREISEEAREPAKAGEGLNLGLDDGRRRIPASAATTRRIAVTPPPRFGRLSDARGILTDFVRAGTAAALVPFGDMGRLEALSGAGRAPDWTLEPAPATDQVAFLAIVDLPRQDLEARQALSKKLVEHLLGDESQKALSKIRAFRTLPGESMYASQAGFAQLERAIADGVRVPSVFDADFRELDRRAADDSVTRAGGKLPFAVGQAHPRAADQHDLIAASVLPQHAGFAAAPVHIAGGTAAGFAGAGRTGRRTGRRTGLGPAAGIRARRRGTAAGVAPAVVRPGRIGPGRRGGPPRIGLGRRAGVFARCQSICG